MIGSTISHYKILEKLGEGGMGVVYKALDTKLNRFVALKFLPQHLLATGAEKARFVQEARSAAVLNHPHACTIYRIDEFDGQQFIEMEYVDGQTLKQKLPIQQLDDAVSYAIQIIEALQEAHAHGIIHRDIKSENIMVNSRNQIKVMDFGLAKLKGSLNLTQTSSTVGTLAYMAPEVIQGQEADERSDIFSAGVVLYEMFAGRLPFRGEHSAAMMYSIVNQEADPLSSIRPGIPPAVLKAISRALEKSPEHRYRHVSELLSDLGQAPKLRENQAAAKPSPSKSIAVLPFDNISSEKENEYFSDGLTEEIITSLSKIRSLKVISRTTIIRFKGTQKSTKEIAAELDVQYILEGSVRKHGHDLRITAQLIDASKDVHVWAEKYRGTIDDVFDIQEKVAGEIAEALRLELSPSEEIDLKKRFTENSEAYQLFLQGKFYWNKRTRDGLLKAIEFYRQAADVDERYALPHAGIADCYNLLSAYGFISPRESFTKAQSAALKALELDGTLAEAHEALGHVGMLHEGNWKIVEQEYLRAVQLNPEYATALQRYAIFLTVMKRPSEALAHIRLAQQFEPLSLIIGADVALVLLLNGRPDEAIQQCEKTIDLDANFAVTYFVLGLSHLETGDCEKAVQAFRKSVDISNGAPIYLSALAHAQALNGQSSEAAAILVRLEAEGRNHYISPYYKALISAGMGDFDSAMEATRKALDEGATWLIHLHISVDPRLRALRSNPEFTSNLVRLGLPS